MFRLCLLWQPGRLRDRVVDFTDDVAAEIPQALFHEVGRTGAIDGANPRRHIFEEQAVLGLEAARSRQAQLLDALFEILISGDAVIARGSSGRQLRTDR